MTSWIASRLILSSAVFLGPPPAGRTSMKLKSALGIIAGLILIASAFAHSVLGWNAMNARLAQTNAPADLVQGLQVGWMFGGPVMIVFGILSVVTFVKRFRG